MRLFKTSLIISDTSGDIIDDWDTYPVNWAQNGVITELLEQYLQKKKQVGEFVGMDGLSV